ncbi:hypothetical protein GGI23_000060 [Coemansia sp. RSA 2559]|nr:hypothetical protein GGI23_000060 [Coemansia sp. RSA 2559]KAJ2869699.1 hypothetical protein GGI22_000099 [Coemansia erecta]
MERIGNNPVSTGTATDIESTDPREWSVEQATMWVHSFLAPTSIPDEYESNGIDGAALVEGMTYRILHNDLEFKVGPALNVMRHVERLRTQWGIVPIALDSMTNAATKEEPAFVDIKAEPPFVATSPSAAPVPLPATPTTSIASAPSANIDSSDSAHSKSIHTSDDIHTSTSESWDDAVSQLSRYLGGQKDYSVPQARRLSLLSAYFAEAGAGNDTGDDDGEDEHSGMWKEIEDSVKIDATEEAPVHGDAEAASDRDMSISSGESAQEEPGECKMEDSELVARHDDIPERIPEKKVSQPRLKNKKMAEEEEENDGPPKKTRRRVAPCLITMEIPEVAKGNIVEQGVAEARLWLPSAQSLPPNEARKILDLAFPKIASFGVKYDIRRKQYLAAKAAAAVGGKLLPKEALSPSDTMWFRRIRKACTPIVVNKMGHVQAWHRLLIARNDAALYIKEGEEGGGAATTKEREEGLLIGEDQVLPVYGESNSSSGEISDNLHREIQHEQKEQHDRKHRTESAERQRVSLVEAVINEMAERYVAEWEVKEKPQMERRAHVLWTKHKGNSRHLRRDLDDLQDRRLPRERKAVLDSGVGTRRQAVALCTGFQPTVGSICRAKWLLALVGGPQPLRSKMRLAEDAAHKQTKDACRKQLIHDEGVSRSSDSMDDFIDDSEEPQQQQQKQQKQQEGISDGLGQLGIGEDQVIANGFVRRHTASPFVEHRRADATDVDITDGNSTAPSEPQTPASVQPASKGARAAALVDVVVKSNCPAEDGHDIIDIDSYSQGDVEVARGSIARAPAERATTACDSQIVVDLTDESAMRIDHLSESQAEAKGKNESQTSADSAFDSLSPETKRVRLRYGRRSMAAKEIDGPLYGESLADSEQGKVAKRKQYQKRQQQQQHARAQANDQTQPLMTQEELETIANKYKAADVYDAAVAYVRQLAATAGTAEIPALQAKGAKIGMRVALRLWAEFQGWCAMGSGSSNSSVGEQFEGVADSLVRIGPAEQRAQRRRLVQTPHGGAVGGSGKHRQLAAFRAFWEWRHAVASDSVGAPLLVNPGHGPARRDAWIPGFLAARLHEHQVAGVRFAWRAAIEGDGGCILAHAMGLGKTLQAVALIYTLLSEVRRGADAGLARRFASRRVLVLCPVTVQDNWADEFRRWTGLADTLASAQPPPPALPPQSSASDAREVQRQARRVLVQVVHFGRMRSPQMRETALRAWATHGGVLLMGYPAFRDAMSGDARELRGLLAGGGGPCLVVADEAHVLKNRQSQVAALAAALPTQARICMTGSPLQNRLEEYWTMADFCRTGLLRDLADFRASYATPINAGLYADSSGGERRESRRRLRVLQAVLETIVDRRDASVLHSSLPRKVEYIIACPLTAPQDALYRQYLDANVAAETARLFEHGVRLGLLCNHPAISMTGATPEWCAAVAAACGEPGEPGSGSGAGAAGSSVGRVGLSAKAALALAIVRFSVLRSERPLVDQFNDAANKARVFLISAATASVGVNLPAASRVVIFDVGWNPLYDDQAVARAYRYGQRRRVYVYRLMTSGTWEEHLFRSNVFKVALTRRVIDGQPMGRLAARAELKRYFRAPPAGVALLPAAEAERLAAAYADDLVFSALMRSSHRELVASVTPHATLLANEDDALLLDDDGPSLEMLVRCEKERLGLLPPSVAGPSNGGGVPVAMHAAASAPASAAATAAAASSSAGDDDVDPENIDAEIIDVENYTAAFVECSANGSAASGSLAPEGLRNPEAPLHQHLAPVQHPDPPPGKPAQQQSAVAQSPAITPPPAPAAGARTGAPPRYRVRGVEAMLGSIIIRLGRLPMQAPLQNPRNLATFTRLFSGWLVGIQEFICVESLDAQLRRNKSIDEVKHLIPGSESMMAAVVPMHNLTDAELRRVVENHAL